ncbi:MAG: NAD(P)H-hydrate epimerase [Candidatus Promineifilaceae bacterium]|jgi:NAD(P)H-hydrate epimerase
MDIPTVKNVPFVDTLQMIEVDRAMIEDYHITLIQMMENAGRNLANLSRLRFLDGNPAGKRVIVLAGTGGNGGGGLVAARRLHNYGARVTVYVTAEDERFTPVPAHQLDILRRMGVEIIQAEKIKEADIPDLIIDSIIGYSLKGAPRGGAKELIEWTNRAHSPILALDAPSGIDTASGQIFDPAIQATATLTLALPKKGFQQSNVAQHLGELYLGDISVPPGLYAKEPLNLVVGTIFSSSDIVRIDMESY